MECDGHIVWAVKTHDGMRHPGPFRIPQIDSEFAGIIVAIGFVVLGLVAFPFAKWFLLGSLGFGIAMVLVLRFVRKN